MKKSQLKQGQLVMWDRATRQGVVEIPATYKYLTKTKVAIEVETKQGRLMRFVERSAIRDLSTLRAGPGKASYESGA